MNTTTIFFSLPNDSNSIAINNQSWFIPLDIILIVCLTLAFILSLVFLCIILLDKTCHTVAMMLAANSCFAGLFFTFTLIWMTIISLHNDLKQIQYEDPPCKLRTYISYSGVCALFYSYLLQAIYRYMLVVYPTRLLWQSTKFQFFLIILTWIAAFVGTSPYIPSGEIRYHVDDQICQLYLHVSIILIYDVLYVYIIPINSTIFIYFKLVRYVKQINRRTTHANTVSRAQKELRMVFRIVIIVLILNILGLPYLIFVIMGLFTQPPKYHFRIAFTFVDISLLLIIIALFRFTDPVKASVLKIINKQQNIVVVPAI
ncbi:unnamed protein product [Adineta steineri]|uniref:G-protein coupled receptors family 1 profile domain-containing protein n=1 Tax=Adineta steineri TaxID=433720 RepID=A0A814UPB1_9BILA|nr:unnamed protein product [Adineta steineri]CAF1177504.1 unnamed protein product [Adineta steineri]